MLAEGKRMILYKTNDEIFIYKQKLRKEPKLQAKYLMGIQSTQIFTLKQDNGDGAKYDNIAK